MDSEVTAPLVDKDNGMPETSGSRSSPIKKNKVKIPKRVHKSQREKLKREHLNDLFLDLGNAVGLTQQSNGKASILIETTRLLKDMLGQVESLKRENASLLSESQYVNAEKNELRDETSVLESQIKKLKNEIDTSIAQSEPRLNPGFRDPELASHFVDDHVSASDPHQTPVMGPLYVIPYASAYHNTSHAPGASNPTSNVSKPHARYPTSADSWPSQLLGEQPRAG